jgi:galactokinase
MTRKNPADQLREFGLDGRDVESRRALFDLVVSRFRRLGGGWPEHVFWVPGRLEVFGKHTDYGGGRTLVSAVPRGFAIAISRRFDSRINVADAGRLETASFETNPAVARRAAMIRAASKGWRHYVQTVIGRLTRNFSLATLSSEIVFASDLPRASGMSSSSALMVGVAAALGRVAGLEYRPEWRENIGGPLDAASYYACIENGLSFGTLAGDSGVGTHGGSEDHAAIVTGKAGQLSAFSFVPMRHIRDVELPDDWRFVLTPSGVAADKTGGAKGPYNRLARGAAVLLQLWNAAGSNSGSLAAALGSSPDAADRLRELVNHSHVDDWPPVSLLKRLDHFIREDARIPLCLDAMQRLDATALGHLSAESQADAETLLENQVPETVELVASARRLGAFASSSFGAGFGGSVWALVHHDAADRFAEAWRPGAFVARPAPPLAEL